MIDQSPTSVPEKLFTKGENFFDALKKLADGDSITRLEWEDKRWYCLLKDGIVQIHKPGEKSDKLHAWIINDGDLKAEDWVTL